MNVIAEQEEMIIIQIYLAGGMTNVSFEEANRWRVKIKHELENYECDSKIKCINPQDYYKISDDSAYDSEREVMEFDLYNVKTSDILIVNFNDVHSLGTMAEMATAYELRKPILGLNIGNEELHPWQEEMCNKMFDDMDKLINYVKNYYL